MTAPTLRAQVERAAALEANERYKAVRLVSTQPAVAAIHERNASALAALIGIAEAAEWETKRADAWEGRWRLLMKLRFGTKSADEIQADPLLREMQAVELQVPIPHPARDIELDRRELAGEEPSR